MERKKADKNNNQTPPSEPVLNPLPGLDLPPEFGQFIKAFMKKRGPVFKRLADFDKGHD